MDVYARGSDGRGRAWVFGKDAAGLGGILEILKVGPLTPIAHLGRAADVHRQVALRLGRGVIITGRGRTIGRGLAVDQLRRGRHMSLRAGLQPYDTRTVPPFPAAEDGFISSVASRRPICVRTASSLISPPRRQLPRRVNVGYMKITTKRSGCRAKAGTGATPPISAGGTAGGASQPSPTSRD
jgi:hypothetical protein